MQEEGYYQEYSFGSEEEADGRFAQLLEGKEQEILSLREEVDQVRAHLHEYKRKEIMLCDLIKRLADKLQPKTDGPSTSARGSVRGKQEIRLPFTSSGDNGGMWGRKE